MYGLSSFAEKLNIQNFVNSAGNCVRYICMECLDLQRNGISRMRKLKWKLCTLYARNVWISRKIEYLLLHIFNGKLCTLYMYGMPGFAKKSFVQNCENSTGNCVQYICTESNDLLKYWISRTMKLHREIVYIIYVRNVWICRKIEYPELRKFNRKLCTLYMYGMFGLAKKLNVQSCENSTENCVHYICMACLD